MANLYVYNPLPAPIIHVGITLGAKNYEVLNEAQAAQLRIAGAIVEGDAGFKSPWATFPVYNGNDET